VRFLRHRVRICRSTSSKVIDFFHQSKALMRLRTSHQWSIDRWRFRGRSSHCFDIIQRQRAADKMIDSQTYMPSMAITALSIAMLGWRSEQNVLLRYTRRNTSEIALWNLWIKLRKIVAAVSRITMQLRRENAHQTCAVIKGYCRLSGSYKESFYGCKMRCRR